MSAHVILETSDWKWIDCKDPILSQLQELSDRYHMPLTLLQDCMDTRHLPKFEKSESSNFSIFRAFDERCSPEADTIQELTRKVAVFWGKDFMITIHRTEQPFMMDFLHTAAAQEWHGPASAVFRLLERTLATYEPEVERLNDRLDALEAGVFAEGKGSHFDIHQAYLLKRRASLFRRLTRLQLEAIVRLSQASDASATRLQDLRERCEALAFHFDEVLESAVLLLNLHLSLSSQRVNLASHQTGEVVRLLTLFSVFILPLTLITGIYGMNFQHMPELVHPLGYPTALGFMAAIEVGIFLYFRRKGWLR
jgi:magnesium transporter